jgi:hypothetical protein
MHIRVGLAALKRLDAQPHRVEAAERLFAVEPLPPAQSPAK